ncbi:hypothetical protein AB4120_14825 [Cupriavidus sp. 2KB_3]|uniref:hypothetical protein n=1 Tax=Cupriavidus sp. 2KB_3 TaxID=3232980 RepID=UPI003F91BE34
MTLVPPPKLAFEDSYGKPLVGGKLYAYDAGTSTPKNTYQDLAQTSANTNPIILDARGECIVYGTGNYRLVLKDANDNQIWDRDNVAAPGNTGLPSGGASGQVLRVDGGGNPQWVSPKAGRNKFIDGAFRSNGGNYASGTPTTGSNQYTLDMVRVTASGESLVFSALGIGNIVTAPPSGFDMIIAAADMEGGTYALNWGGTGSITINGTPRNKGDTFTLPANTTVTAHFSGGTFSEVQLEKDYVTAFDYEPPEVLRLRVGAYVKYLGVGVMATAYSTTAAECVICFQPPMRSAPTLSQLQSAVNLRVAGANSNIGITLATISAERKGINFTITRTSGTWSKYDPIAVADELIARLDCRP